VGSEYTAVPKTLETTALPSSPTIKISAEPNRISNPNIRDNTQHQYAEGELSAGAPLDCVLPAGVYESAIRRYVQDQEKRERAQDGQQELDFGE
jgi:hypothetical protein